MIEYIHEENTNKNQGLWATKRDHERVQQGTTYEAHSSTN